MPDLACGPLLRKTFGFAEFKPGQADIIARHSRRQRRPGGDADGTIAAQKVLSAIVRTGERFGTEHLANVLTGESTEAVEKFGHDCLPTFGVGKEFGKPEWRSIFRQLCSSGVIAVDVTGHGTWLVTEAGRRVLKGVDKVTLRKDTLRPATRKAARAAANAAALADGAPGNTALFEALRQCRSALAKTQRVAAYVVFADKTLLDMARRKPATMAEMASVHSVGEEKLRQYSAIFLDAIRQHVAAGFPRVAPHPALC
jgi:ATP-dependent DNA helicase RecQ